MSDLTFGPYQLEELLGRGGMGEVWRAHDSRADRRVALKLLHPQFAEDREYRERFRRESTLAGRLNEPHIIPVHASGEMDGRLYLDMRLVEGDDLGTVLRRDGALRPDVAVAVVEQVAAALDAAHAAGLVHRDVKPSNVLLARSAGQDSRRPFAYLVDFGIARTTGPGADTSITAHGALLGTPAYMAPELFRGEPPTAQSDVYALACVLHELLTGAPVHPAVDGWQGAMHAHLYMLPTPPSQLRGGLSPRLDDVVARGLAKDPAARWRSAGELAAAARWAVASPTTAGRATGQFPAAPATGPTVQQGPATGPWAPTHQAPSPTGSWGPPPHAAPTGSWAPGGAAPSIGPGGSSAVGDRPPSRRWVAPAAAAAAAALVVAIAAVLIGQDGSDAAAAGAGATTATTATTATATTTTAAPRTTIAERTTTATPTTTTTARSSGAALPGVAPASPPEVRRTSGATPLNLSSRYHADLDSEAPNWAVSRNGSDTELSFDGSARSSWSTDLAPVQGAADFGTCATATAYRERLTEEDMEVGSSFCVRTDEGRFAFVTLTALSEASATLDVTVWEKAG